MKEIIVRTPKEEQFYEVVEFYGKEKHMYHYNTYNENSVFHYQSISDELDYGSVEWFKENMPSHEIITFEQWKELVGKKESVSNELIQDIDLDI